MIEYEYYYDQYRRVPRNSAVNQKDLIDYNSAVSGSMHNVWSGVPLKRHATTNYIDGNELLGLRERPNSMKGLFPKGKSRRKSAIPCEKRINTGDPYISLVPTEKPTYELTTYRSEKTRSPLSMATGTYAATLPDVQRKNTSIRNSRISSAAVSHNGSVETKSHGRLPTADKNAGWVRRYKSINESHTLTDLLRDPNHLNKAILNARTCQQLSFISSTLTSSLIAPFMKRRRAKCS